MASLLNFVCVGVLICSIYATISVSKYVKKPAPDATNTSNFSLLIDSELLLFTVQNTTEGLRVSIDQTMRDSHPQAITFNDVYLPSECNSAPCNVLVHESVINETIFQYELGVPANNSMLLLQFQYNVESQEFGLDEDVVIRNELAGEQCSPTATGYVAEFYTTLCINLFSKTGNLLIVNLLLKDFNLVIDTPFQDISFPIEDIAFLYYPHSEFYINGIFFPIGAQKLAIVEPVSFESYTWTVPDCNGVIHKLALRNDTDIDLIIPFLIYCDTNYVVADFLDFDSPYFAFSHFYNETGYPLVCRNEKDSIVAEVAVFKDTVNTTIAYNGNNVTLPGLDIDLQNSSCFGFKSKLFYLYYDGKEGVVLVDLVAKNWSVLDCQYHCNFKVFANQYILLEEAYGMNNVTLRLFDVLALKFISEQNTNHTTDLSYLLSLPKSPSRKGYLNLLAILLGSIGGSSVLFVFIAIIVLAVIGGIFYWRRRNIIIVPCEQTPSNERSPLVPGTNKTPVCV